MKFDVVIGNPPFHNKTEKKSLPLWKRFTLLSLSLIKKDGYLCLITPNAWLSDKKVGPIIKEYDVIHINLVRHFTTKIQSSFLYFILKNTPYSEKTLIETKNEVFTVNLKTEEYIPTKNISSLSLRIFKNFFEKECFEEFIPSNDTRIFSKTQSDIFKYPAYHTKAQPLIYTRKEHAVNEKKVIFQVVSNFEPFYDNGTIGVGRGCKAILVKDEIEGKNLLSFMNSKLFTFIQKNSRKSGWYGMPFIPKIDLSQSWNDKKVYKHFNITTKEEIEFIETRVDNLFYDKN